MPKAEAAARRSLEFDPSSAEAYGALAHAQMHQWKFADAEKAFARALALNPNITSTYFAYGEYLAALGKEDKAVAELRKGLKIEPLSAEILLMLPFPLYLERNYAAAEAAGAAAIQAHPDFWALYMGRGYSYLAEGRFPEAIADFEKGRALNPEATVNLAGLAASYARSGNRSEGTKVLAALRAMKSRRYVSPFDLAVVYQSFGDSAQALDCLDQAYRDNSEMMLFLDLYPPLAGLRSNPRFRELVRRVGAAPK
jgi:tetratricopeptide (TPR) repeat protein